MISKPDRDKQSLASGVTISQNGDVVQPANQEDVYVFPASFAQQRLWFIDRLKPGTAVYNICDAFVVEGPLNVPALEQSINEIVRRHESLRTTFTAIDGDPVQVISPALELHISVLDLSHICPAEQEAEASRLISKEAHRPFDLAKGPLIRPTILSLGDEQRILILTTHHIISDGWSQGIFMQELAELYRANCHGTTVNLPELPVQYADYAMWQRDWMQQDVLQEQLSYWKKQLAGVPSILQLPFDRARPAVQSYAGRTRELLIPKRTAEAIMNLARQSGATLFMTLLAVFEVLLHRYTGQEDVLVGAPIAGRNRSETERLIGFFVNSLALRCNLADNPPFSKLLEQVRQVTLDAYAHAELPFERLVQELHPDRSLGFTPIIQTMFVLQNRSAMPSLEDESLHFKRLKVHTDTSKFDLTFQISEVEEGLECQFEYSTDLFEMSSIDRMIGHFRTLLEGVVRNPDARIEELPILTEEERHQLLLDWNLTSETPHRDLCIHEMFEAQARKNPDSDAAVFKEERLSYNQLNRRADSLAAYLRQLHVRPEVRVGICLQRSIDMLSAILGVLKAGGVYVPLDPTYPTERLAFILEDAQISLLICEKGTAKGLPSSGPPRLIDIHEIPSHHPLPMSQDATLRLKNSNLAYVIYTSGSTGRPKGVAIEHHSAVALIDWATQVYRQSELSGVLASTSICFDLSIFEMFVPLSCGGKVIIAENLFQLPFLPAANELTLINTVPSLISELLKAHALPENVQTVNLAGEPLSSRLVQQIYSHSSVKRVFDLYGPSETTTYSTFTLRRGDGPETIGRPVAGTEIYILDSNLQPVPIGVSGEIFIGGRGVARGYLNRPELTTEKFIPNPFSQWKGGRLYRTGDLGRYFRDGNIEFLGRMDHQVKLRGFRIELGEVEAAMNEHPAVEEAVMLIREDVPDQKRLVAYVVLSNRECTWEDLRQFLQQKLPSYMVPSVFVVLERLPRTPNGKLDRRALPVPEEERTESGEKLDAPRDALELQLAKMWERLLNIRPIGIHDNFFEIGGHSLIAVRLFAQIEKSFGKSLSVATLFQAPTVDELAKVLRQEGLSSSWSSLVPIQMEGSKPPFFAIHAGGGHVLFYRDMARLMGPDQPFYGLQAQGLDGKLPRHYSVEEMAAHYIQEIRSLQPEGPYNLGGASFGGLVSFEMACQLHAQGQKVGLVALFDTHAPGYPRLLPTTKKMHSRFFALARRVEHHVTSLLMLEPKEKVAYFLAKTTKAKKMFKKSVKKRFKQVVRKIYLFLGQNLPKPLRVTQDAIQKANESYVPKVYPGRVTLFRASKQPYGIYPDPSLGWTGLAAGGLDIYEVSGYHGAIVSEPRVRVTVEKLKACLEREFATESAKRAAS
jgi:amino acid adenylation domain-containing protein